MIRLIAVLAAVLWMSATAWAHPPLATAALVNIDGDGRVVIHVVHDALAFALNDTSARIGDREMYVLLDGPEQDLASAFADGRERFKSGFHLVVDGQEVPVEIAESPDVAGVRQWKKEHPGRTLPCKLDFVVKATLPARAQTITLAFPDILGDTILIVTRVGVEPSSMPLSAGETSPEIDVSMLGGAASSRPGEPSREDGSSPAPRPRTSQEIGPLGVAWRFVKLGFLHIVGFVHMIPRGLDHCLFVFGLFLLSPRIKPVLWQISSFTLAHTITLTLTSLHIVGLPRGIVEPAIAASIAFIGVENLLTTKVHSWRIAVAFVFGLVHGMGVATAFNEAGFPPGQLVTSLAAFTVGVEGGHIAVLVAAFAALGWSKDKKWYRTRVAIPLSLIIAAIALFWIVQRVMASA